MSTFIVKQLNGVANEMSWDEDCTIESLKANLSLRLGFATEDMRLIYSGRGLGEGSKTLLEYGISPNAIVHLVMRLRGDGSAQGAGAGAACPVPTKEMISKAANPPRDDREKEKNEGEASETYADVIRARSGEKM